MCKSYTGARFQKPTKIKSQYGYVFLLNGGIVSWKEFPSGARLLILQQRVGRVETQTVKLVSEVWLVVTLWRQEDTKWDWIPTDVPTVIYALRHDHLEMVISRYDKVADEDDVADPPMTMSYEIPSTGLT